VVALLFSACGDGGEEENGDNNNNNNNSNNNNDNNDNSSNNENNTLTISGEQVYLLDWDEDTYVTTYTPFTGNRTVYSYYTDWTVNTYPRVYYNNGGGGSITNGKLSFSIGKPIYLEDIDKLLDRNIRYAWTDVRASDTSVKCSELYLSTNANNYYDGSLGKVDYNGSVSGNNCTGNEREVGFIYVDKDVTITGKGRTEPYNYTDPDTGYTENWTEKTNDINLSLKAGWNTVYSREESSGTFIGTWPDYTNITGTETVSITLENPASTKWVLWEFN